MELKSPILMVAAFSGFSMLAGGVVAQDQPGADVVEASFELDDGAAVRIGITGKLRTLSQMIPASACQVASGYDPDYATVVMNEVVAEFDSIINALEFGNDDLGVPTAEERRTTLVAIQNVRDAWKPMQMLVEDVSAGSDTREQLQHALEDATNLLDAAKALVVKMVAQYSNPSQMAQAESFLIDIAGYQRTLIQMMSKTACLSLLVGPESESRESLVSTMSRFEATLEALQNGMPSVGIRKPPNDAIEAGLIQVAADWREIKPFLEAVARGDALAHDETEGKFRSLNELLATMDNVVGLYAASVTG